MVSVTSPMDDITGRTLVGRYVVQRRLGTGGAGVVYVALDLRLGAPVALKVLRPELRTDGTFVRELRREAQVISQMQHPHVVRVLDLLDVGPPIGLVLVMEYMPNGSLKDLVRRGRRLDDAQVARIAQEVASALAAAHAHGLTHRDVKPGNILLDETGHVRLADFGLVRHASETSGGRHAGTPRYAAPEQLRSALGAHDELASRSEAPADTYALGLVLYELATGSFPFEGGSIEEVARQRLTKDVVNPEPGRQLLDVVVRMTHRDPNERPDDETLHRLIDELVRALPAPSPLPLENPARDPEAVLDPSSLSVAFVPPDQGRTVSLTNVEARPPARRRRRVWLILLVIVVVAALGATWYLAVRRLRVPRLADLEPAAARSRLSELGFFRIRTGETYSATVAPGRVVGTVPGAGVALHPLAVVEILVSRGHAPVVAPDVVGFIASDARRALSRVGLGVRLDRAYSATVSAGTVIREPLAGQRVRWHGVVVLIVSAGPPPRAVPAVAGEPEATAAAALRAAGFAVTTSQAYSTSVPSGDVVSESPSAGTVAPFGSAVALVISQGPPDVAVPNLFDDTFAQAVAALQADHLTYGQLTTPGGLSLNGVASYLGTSAVVVAQGEPAGTEVPVGSAVNLVLAPNS